VRRSTAGIVGALAGGLTGTLLLWLAHPTAAYTNDAYRQGASAGYVARYVALGVVAALLIRTIRLGRHVALAGLGLAAVMAAAVLPPALDDRTPSEERRAAATAIDDRQQRTNAERRAGAIDGCAEAVRTQIDAGAFPAEVEPDSYCTCFIDAILEGPRDDAAQLDEMHAALASARPAPKFQRFASRCAREAAS
jgi:hypothetical protein